MNKPSIVMLLILFFQFIGLPATSTDASAEQHSTTNSLLNEPMSTGPIDDKERKFLLKGRLVRETFAGKGSAILSDGRKIARIPHGLTRISNGPGGTSIHEHWTELFTASDDGLVYHLGDEFDDGTFEASNDPPMNEQAAEAAKQGDYRTAVMHYGRALRIARGVLGEHNPRLLQILQPYAVVLKHFSWPEESKDVAHDIMLMTRQAAAP